MYLMCWYIGVLVYCRIGALVCTLGVYTAAGHYIVGALCAATLLLPAMRKVIKYFKTYIPE